MMVCIVLTPCFSFACSVCFGSFQNLILSGFAKDQVAFLQEDYRTPIFLSIFFLEMMFVLMPLFVDFVRYRTF